MAITHPISSCDDPIGLWEGAVQGVYIVLLEERCRQSNDCNDRGSQWLATVYVNDKYVTVQIGTLDAVVLLYNAEAYRSF